MNQVCLNPNQKFKFNNFLAFSSLNYENLIEVYNITEFLSIGIFIAGLTLISFNFSNLIITLIGIELLLLAANINFLVTFTLTGDGAGLVFALCILTISAAETAIGAGLLIICYSIKKTVEFQDLNTLQD